MANRATAWLVAGFVAGVLLTGPPFWQLPYNYRGPGYPGQIAGLLGLGLVTALLAGFGPARLKHVFWAMLAAFPAAVGGRVFVEVLQDPTDHNLWPFELIYAAVVSLAAVVPGILAGWAVRRVRR